MFSRRNKSDLFEERKKLTEVWKSVRRIVDATAPNLTASELRAHDRYARCIPALVVECDDEGPIPGSSFYATTRDFSDNGVCLVSSDRPQRDKVICGFCHDDDPVFFAGHVCRSGPLGGGFYHIAVEFSESIPSSEVPRLIPQAQELIAEVSI